MTANLEKFTRELNQLLKGRHITSTDLVWQTATILLALEINSESKPPADLRARWVTQTRLVTIERKSPVNTLRARPFATLLIALLIMLILSGVAYAIGRSLGYIPGMGIIDRSAPLRVMEEPVSQTQDGITVTVKDAILSSDKTIITYTVENIPPDKLSPITDVPCPHWPQLRLPNGKLYKLDGGDGNVNEMRLIYAPLPADIQDATLLIPCIQGAGPGVLPLPENWELTLRFIPAPPDVKVFPVIELTPSPIVDSSAAEKNPLTISKIIDTSDSYILIGEFQSLSPSSQEIDSGVSTLKITDGNGQDIFFEGFPQDLGMPTPTSPTAEVWAVKFSKGFVPPIHITYAKQYILADPSQETVEFEFDAGEDPHAVRTWKMNEELTLANHTFSLASVVALPSNYYEFNFTSTDNSIYGVDVVIDDYPPDAMGGGMDAGAIGTAGGSWGVPIGPYRELPSGKLKVILSQLWYVGEIKDWTIDWQP